MNHGMQPSLVRVETARQDTRHVTTRELRGSGETISIPSVAQTRLLISHSRSLAR